VFERSTGPAAGAALLAGALLVAACGGDSASAAASRSESAAAPPSAGTSAVAASSADTVSSSGLQVTHLDVGGHVVTAEVADNDLARQRGLMYRDSLPTDHGMLFVYPSEQTLSFWMRNTEIPLDIAFITAAGSIVDIQHMKAESDSLHTSARPSMYALEMAKGWFERNGVKVGDTVKF